MRPRQVKFGLPTIAANFAWKVSQTGNRGWVQDVAKFGLPTIAVNFALDIPQQKSPAGLLKSASDQCTPPARRLRSTLFVR